MLLDKYLISKFDKLLWKFHLRSLQCSAITSCSLWLTSVVYLGSSDVEDDDEGISADTVLACIIRFNTQKLQVRTGT